MGRFMQRRVLPGTANSPHKRSIVLRVTKAQAEQSLPDRHVNIAFEYQQLVNEAVARAKRYIVPSNAVAVLNTSQRRPRF